MYYYFNYIFCLEREIMYKDLEKIVNCLREANSIVISGHTGPDGDAIGASTALYSALKQLGKEVIIYQEEICKSYEIIPNFNKISSQDIEMEIDLFVAVDCGDFNRLEENGKKYFNSSKNTISIDHHVGNPNFADFNIVDTNSTSTCEIIYFVIEKLCPFNKDIASSIYAGIVFDSGGFKYDKTSKRTHEICSYLHEFDIDFTEIYNKIDSYMTIKQFSMFRYALSKVIIDTKNKIGSLLITLEDFEKNNSSKDDIEGIASFILNIEELEASVFIYEQEKDFCKCSIRSKRKDINVVARKFGGGGHILASGCVIKESGVIAMEKLLIELENLV